MKNDEKSSSSVDLAALQLLVSSAWLVAAGSSSADIEHDQHRTEFSRSAAVECFPLDLYTASSFAQTFPPQKGEGPTEAELQERGAPLQPDPTGNSGE